jgi:hypothetical protein
VASSRLTLTIKIYGLRETLAKFKDLPPDASRELRKAARKVAEDVANDARRRASQRGRQAALLVPTIHTNLDRVPSVSAGGSLRVGRNRKPAFKVLFGAEFGAKFLKQFSPRNTFGYFFYPAYYANKDKIDEQWNAAADAIVNNFTAGDVIVRGA